jgi:autotransporter-associated beta strand protein
LGASGSIVQEGTKQNITVAKLLESGTIHASGTPESSSTVNTVIGKYYSAQLYYWDSWDGERGELFIRNNPSTVYYIFRANRSYTGGFTVANGLAGTYQSCSYSLYNNLNTNLGQLSNYNDQYVDISFLASYTGSLNTWQSLDQGTNDESIQLKNVWETSFGTESFSSDPRAIELITTNTTQDACLIAGVISGGLSLKKSGTGRVKLSNYNVYTNGTIVDAGILQLHDPGISNGKGVIINTLTVNQNGTVQLTGSPAALGWWNTSNGGEFRVTTLNINGGIVEAIGGPQHIWNMTYGVNFSGGGTLRCNGGTSSSSTLSDYP